MSDVAGGEVSKSLTKKIGPLPGLVWVIIIVAGAYGVYYYRKSHAVTVVADPNNASQSVAGGVPAVTSGQFGPGLNGNPAVSTNAQWAATVANGLIATGQYSPTDVSNALSGYLNGSVLSPAQQAIVNIALTKYGTPPEGVLPVSPAPAQVQTPVGTAASVVRYIRNSVGTIAAQFADNTIIPLHFPEWSALADSGAVSQQVPDSVYNQYKVVKSIAPLPITPQSNRTLTSYIRRSDGTIASLYSDNTLVPLSLAEWTPLAAEGAVSQEVPDSVFNSYNSVTSLPKITSLTGGPRLYTVAVGDTIASIESRFGGNSVTDTNGSAISSLTPGQTVMVA